MSGLAGSLRHAAAVRLSVLQQWSPRGARETNKFRSGAASISEAAAAAAPDSLGKST